MSPEFAEFAEFARNSRNSEFTCLSGIDPVFQEE